MIEKNNKLFKLNSFQFSSNKKIMHKKLPKRCNSLRISKINILSLILIHRKRNIRRYFPLNPKEKW